MKRLLIVCALDQARLVAEYASNSGLYDKIAFLADEPNCTELMGFPVIDEKNVTLDILRSNFDIVTVASGNNRLRLEKTLYFLRHGFCLPAIIHPTAVVHKTALIMEGSFIAPNAVIGPWASIGRACLVNTAAIVEHDCVLKDGVHVSPGAVMGGHVYIGTCSWVCVGTNIANNINIGSDSVIGAGAAVVSNVENKVLAAGVPAVVKKRY